MVVALCHGYDRSNIILVPDTSMETTLKYLAASANRYGHAAAISDSQSIVAFASHKFVVLWKLSVRSIHL